MASVAGSGSHTAHVDTFARDNLPPVESWPEFSFTFPDGSDLTYPERLNAAVELLDRNVERGLGDRPSLHFEHASMSYRELLEQANQVAHVLVDDLGVVPGNRVLVHGPN